MNQSGGSYPSAQLKLVAGEVNRAPSAAAAAPAPALLARMARSEEVDRGFTESGLAEYHLYTLGRRTDLPDNSTKQLELFPAAHGLACKKQLVFTAGPQPWSYWAAPIQDQGYAATNQGTVGAYLEFENKENNHLGVPLPAGRMGSIAGIAGALLFPSILAAVSDAKRHDVLAGATFFVAAAIVALALVLAWYLVTHLPASQSNAPAPSVAAQEVGVASEINTGPAEPVVQGESRA